MKKARKWVAALTVCAMAFTLTACGGGSDAEKDANAGGEPVVMKLATTVNEEDSFQLAAEKFKEIVEEKTNGAYQIEIYPDGKLGDEATLLESMAADELELGIVTSGPFVNFAPEMGVLSRLFKKRLNLLNGTILIIRRLFRRLNNIPNKFEVTL